MIFWGSAFRTAQPFSIVYLVNNTKEKLTNINIRIQDYSKEATFSKVSKGDVQSTFLTTENLTGERDLYLNHVDKNGNKHEYLILEKFKIDNIQKIKVRINKINDDGTFKIEAFIDNE